MALSIVNVVMQPGFTYDGKSNEMLTHSFRNRLDRVLYRCKDFKPVEATLLGTEPVCTYVVVVHTDVDVVLVLVMMTNELLLTCF